MQKESKLQVLLRTGPANQTRFHGAEADILNQMVKRVEAVERSV